MDITTGSDIMAQNRAHTHGEVRKNLFEGIHFKFPTYKHDHSPVINVNEEADERLTFGQRIADKVASGMGSWRFIIIQTTILLLWAVLNSVGWWSWKWDLYPFIAMNLLLSCQAAYAAPVIMMSQNRQAEKDRLTAQNDYQTDTKGEEEVRHIMEHLDHQDNLILQIVQRLEAQNERLIQQEKLTLEIVQHLDSQNELMKAQHQEMLRRLGDIDPTMAKQLVGTGIVEISGELSDPDTTGNIAGNS